MKTIKSVSKMEKKLLNKMRKAMKTGFEFDVYEYMARSERLERIKKLKRTKKSKKK